MIPLEQFNEEVKDKFHELFPEPDHPGRITKCQCASDEEHAAALSWCVDKDEVLDFITQKFAAHKELILKMVREKAPEFRLTDDCARCTSHNAAIKEFLNNLDIL